MVFLVLYSAGSVTTYMGMRKMLGLRVRREPYISENELKFSSVSKEGDGDLNMVTNAWRNECDQKPTVLCRNILICNHFRSKMQIIAAFALNHVKS